MREPKWRYKLREEAAGIGVTRSDSSRWSSADWETDVGFPSLDGALREIPAEAGLLDVTFYWSPTDQERAAISAWERDRALPKPDVVIYKTTHDGPEGSGPETPTGRKDDSGKIRMDLLPPRAIEAVAAVLTFGAAKYGPDNWRMVEGRRWRYHAAALRHIFAWAQGERCDPETHLHHLAHAACCLLFIVEEEA